ncbi:MAG: histidinol-phosphatase HisJ family protein [Lachnospiraceae bacterium]|jgi:histidinol-phosphatase (PHP family)
MIRTDCHIHSDFSGDCHVPMERMVREGICKGLTVMCFTEHLDLDFPEESGMIFSLDVEKYQEAFTRMKEKYQRQIELLFGIEIGLQPHLQAVHEKLTGQYPFDFVIGSRHLLLGQDPCVPEVFASDTQEALYRRYFCEIKENLQTFSNVDACGHMDYIVRYGPQKNQGYTYEVYKEEIDEILNLLLDKQIALEINSSGYKYGLGHPHPLPQILKRYRKLGGELLTIGSDAHEPQHLAYDFNRIKEVLWDSGFHHYTVFRQRKPSFVRLSF